MSENKNPVPGLGTESQDQWPKLSKKELAQAKERPINLLRPGSLTHSRVLTYLMERLDMSERAMSQFYSRWQANERRIQAYIDLPDYEAILKEQNASHGPTKVVQVTIPYSFATLSTVQTYLLHTFAGRKPMFQVGTYQDEASEASQKMEVVLQYNADHTRLISILAQFFNDIGAYGLGVMGCRWKEEKRNRTVWKPKDMFGWAGALISRSMVKSRELRTVYSGNEVFSIDPFMFFPDPRVPMSQVNKRGEFVFWRQFSGKHELKVLQAAGDLAWIDYAGTLPKEGVLGEQNSVRSLVAGGTANPGYDLFSQGRGGTNFYQFDVGSIEIIPKELGLGDEELPEKWLFGILNKTQVVLAQKLDLDHGMHPIAVSEPLTMGYGFGQLGLADYLGPTQDTLSWLINSHIQNVRTAINNMFVVDPSMVEMQDLKNPGAGKLIRLKRAAYGQDVRTVLQQLQVQDVTANHLRDFELFMRMGDSISSVTDNLRGLQDSGGRKTATEVRTSGEAAASRLAAMARIISAQGIVDLTEQMCLNLQQNLTEDFYLTVVGNDGKQTPLRVSPEHLVGDFFFPVHDGTLPLDRVAMLDVWKEILMGIASSPILSQRFDLVNIFKHVAELGGAKNVERFEIKVVPDDAAAQAAQQGNVVPVPQGASPAPGVVPDPARRMAGAA